MSKKTLNAMKTLQEAFEKNKELTIPQMMTLLNCNRISVNNYIHIPDDAGIKKRLWKAVSERKPFRNFKYVIDGSEYRQKWFDFRRIQLERLVTDYLNSLDIDALAE